MKAVLISDIKEEVSLKLINKFAEMDYYIITTSTEKKLEKPFTNLRRKQRVVLDWNRQTYLAAKTLLLNIKNNQLSLEAAFIIQPKSLFSYPFSKVSPSLFEKIIDTYLKGPFYLMLELLNHFSFLEKGSLNLISYQSVSSDSISELISEYLWHALKKTGKAKFSNKVFVNLFSASLNVSEQKYADFILKNYCEKCNKTSWKVFSL